MSCLTHVKSLIKRVLRLTPPATPAVPAAPSNEVLLPGACPLADCGEGNAVHYNQTCVFTDCYISIMGNHNTVIFHDHCNLSGLRIFILGDENRIEFGERVIVNASPLQPAVFNAIGGRKILVGDGSLFSNNIEIHTSDYHGIYDMEGRRVNPDKDIIIGKSVWVCLGCKILKGSVIADGSIVGAGTVVSGAFREENVIIAGNPGKIIKRNIFWRHEKMDQASVPDSLKAKAQEHETA